MLSNLIRKEMVHQIISSKFTVMLLLVIVLAILSSMVMIPDFKLRMDNYRVLAPDGSDTVAIKAPSPMSMLVKGLDERMGRSINVRINGQLKAGSSQSAANRLFSLFRHVDLHSVALMIMSLAAVLFSFDMISGEKKSGTLKIMISTGVSRSKILLAKWIGAFLVVMIPVIVAILIALITVTFMVPGAVDSDFYLRTILFSKSIALYLSVFTGIGLLISATTHKPSVSLILALLVWGLLVFIVPNAVSLMAKNTVEGESLDQLEDQVSTIWFRETFLLSNNRLEGSYEDYARNVANQMANRYRTYLNLSRRRIDLLGQLSFLSPAGPFNFLSWAFAGTGPIDSINFKEQVVNYQSLAIQDAYKIFLIRRNLPKADQNFKARIFTYQPRTLTEAFANEIPLAIGYLVLMAAILYLITYFAFVRYDVR